MISRLRRYLLARRAYLASSRGYCRAMTDSTHYAISRRKRWHETMLHDYRAMVRARREVFGIPDTLKSLGRALWSVHGGRA